MYNNTLAELSTALQCKKISSVELTQLYLARIKQHNPSLNAYLTVTEELALQQAKQADRLIAKGATNQLTGIPIAHKDIFCTQGVITSCASKMLAHFVAPYESTVTAKLKQAGMVLLGKTNMDEFAMGSSNENSYFGPCKNPWDLTRTPGGSSGGSACAVAARLAPAATGTDTGGSIRQPAAMTGTTGLKPTYGRVSRFGMVAFASSLDQAGPLTQTAEDAALLLTVMAGFDEQDSTSAEQVVPDYTSSLTDSLKGLRIGLPAEYFTAELDSNIQQQLQAAITLLTSKGVTFQSVSLPHSHLAIPAYYMIAPAECSSNLSRFDGVRYGYRCQNPVDLTDLYCRSRGEAFGQEVIRRILAGTYILSAGYYEAYYLKAQKIRRLIKQDFVAAFDEVDLILSPTAPSTAFKLKEKNNDAMYLTDIYTTAVNLAGLPALSIPVGFVNGLPSGMQLIGNYFTEALMLNVAHQYQQHTNWHQQVPNNY